MPINTHFQDVAAAVTYGTINHSIRALDLAALQQQTAIPLTTADHVHRLVQLYFGVKPLLAVIAAIPLLPQPWRAALALFLGTLDAVAASSDRIAIAEAKS